MLTENGSEGQNMVKGKEEFIKEIQGQTEEVYDDVDVDIQIQPNKILRNIYKMNCDCPSSGKL